MYQWEDPLYGEVVFDGVLAELVQTAEMQRLKKIHQNGAIFLVDPSIDTTRFEHSIGVTHIVQRLGCSREEQIAALIHDIPHTAFSHVADLVFDRKDEDFHEDYFQQFIKDSEIEAILKAHGFDTSYILNEDNFPALEQPLPQLCADRIDYCLRDLWKSDMIGQENIQQILNGLERKDSRIVATNEETARELMEQFITLNTEFFMHPAYDAANILFAELLQDALERGILDHEDLFQTDRYVLTQLKQSPLSDQLGQITPDIRAERSSDGNYTVTNKPRLVDPGVQHPSTPLSTIDEQAKKRLTTAKASIPTELRYRITTPSS